MPHWRLPSSFPHSGFVLFLFSDRNILICMFTFKMILDFLCMLSDVQLWPLACSSRKLSHPLRTTWTVPFALAPLPLLFALCSWGSEPLVPEFYHLSQNTGPRIASKCTKATALNVRNQRLLQDYSVCIMYLPTYFARHFAEILQA